MLARHTSVLTSIDTVLLRVYLSVSTCTSVELRIVTTYSEQEKAEEAHEHLGSAALHELMFECIAGSCAARGHVDLLVDRGEVSIDGAQADHEVFCNLGIGQAFCYQA
jgi:hypothetical protein